MDIKIDEEQAATSGEASGEEAQSPIDDAAIVAFLLRNYSQDKKSKSLQQKFAECYREGRHIYPGTSENLYYRFGEEVAYFCVVQMIHHLQSLKSDPPTYEHL